MWSYADQFVNTAANNKQFAKFVWQEKLCLKMTVFLKDVPSTFWNDLKIKKACLFPRIFNIKHKSDHLRTTFPSKCILPLLCILSLHLYLLLFNRKLQSVQIPFMFQMVIQEKKCNDHIVLMDESRNISASIYTSWDMISILLVNFECRIINKIKFKRRDLIVIFHS